MCGLALWCGTMLSQGVQIKGKVTSAEDGSALPGASVIVKGTNEATVTDVNGEFTVNTPESASSLYVSFIGMKTQEVQIAGQKSIDIVLQPDVVGLDEVVVTALGIKREKKALGYAVQDVSGNEISKASNPNLLTAMSGKVAGLEIRQSSGMPGASSQVFIRGARAFSGNNAPLYVVDGMPIKSGTDYDQAVYGVSGSAYSDRTLDIDPNDIASINVLKGQAAAALYGMRASNGVIIITTKTGKGVQGGSGIVTVNASYSIDQISRYPDYQMTYAQGYNGNFTPVSSFSWGPKISNLPDVPTYGGNSQGHPGQFFHAQKNKWVDAKAVNTPKEFFKDGVTKNYGVTIAQPFSNGDYAIGIGATNQEGIIESSYMDRYTAKGAFNYQINSKWKTGFTGNYSDVSIGKLPSGNSSWLFTVFGCPPSYDLMGTPYHAPDGANYLYRQVSYRRSTVGENPLWATKNNKYLEATKRFFGNSYIEYNPFTWMNIHYQLGIDMYTTDNEDILQIGSSQTGQVLPTAPEYPSPNNQTYAYIEPTGGNVDDYGINRRVLNSLLNITFTKQLTDDIKGTLIIGNEINQDNSRKWEMIGTDFFVPGWTNINNTKTQIGDEKKYRNRTVGFFGNASVDYKNMLFFNVTGRNDIVSTMPNGNRSFFYPSVSLGFLFTELDALKGSELLPYGKIRASYAEVGQSDEYHEYTFERGAVGSGFLEDGVKFPLGGNSGFKPKRTLYDPDLKPQNTRSYEFGIELKFFNNRLGIDYTYTDQLAKDQIFKVPLAGSTGYDNIMMNAGEMTSKSHEIVLNIGVIRFNDFKWDISTNYTKVDNKCVKLAEGVESINLGGYEDPNIRASAGETYPAIYGTQFARDAQGHILVDSDPNSDYYGMPMAGDFGKIGNVAPDFIVGLTNTFTYKTITLSALFDWKQGGQMYSGSNYLIDLYGTSKKTEDRTTPFIYDGYKTNADGSITKNDIQRGGENDPLAYQMLYSDALAGIPEAHVYETSFIKLREISLSIGLPKKWTTPIKVQNASISLMARNFLLWTTFKNFDPETSQGNGNMQGGMDYMSLPQTKSYGISLNIVF